jgi:hypothetical protein
VLYEAAGSGGIVGYFAALDIIQAIRVYREGSVESVSYSEENGQVVLTMSREER